MPRRHQVLMPCAVSTGMLNPGAMLATASICTSGLEGAALSKTMAMGVSAASRPVLIRKSPMGTVALDGSTRYQCCLTNTSTNAWKSADPIPGSAP